MTGKAKMLTKASEVDTPAVDTGEKPAVDTENAESCTDQTFEEIGPKKVKIKLFKDNDRYKDDVFVSVNGENYQIQRGVEVEVPDYIAEVLEHAEEQRKSIALTIERLQNSK